VSYAKLKEKLLADKQVLKLQRRKNAPQPVDPAKLTGIIIDDLEMKYGMQDWPCQADAKFVGLSYRKARAHKRDVRDFEYMSQLPESGRYEVRYAYNANPKWAEHLQITVEYKDGSDSQRVNLRKTPPIDSLWISLGVYQFTSDKPAIVRVGLKDAGGMVVTDAVQFLLQVD
jgi:hypothetical protein